MKKPFALLLLMFLCVLVNAPHIFAQSSSTFTFGAAGDFANGSNFRATVDAAAREQLAFNIGLGDFSYSSGAESSWCSTWKARSQSLFLIVGNHDSGESSGGNISNYIQNCPTPIANITGTYGHNYYFDYPATNPTTRFIQIRPGVRGSGVVAYTVGSAGYTFTQNAIDDARAKGIRWIVVSAHKNYISVLEKSNEFGNDIMNLLLSKRVDLILQGHEHGYERSKQLRCATAGMFVSSCVLDADTSLNQGAGTVILVLGTGGQGLRGLNSSDVEYPYFAMANNTAYGFGKFTVSPTQIAYNFVRSAGGTLQDSFVINAGTGSSETPPPNPSTSPSPTPTVYPDLVVTNISWNPSQPVSGNTVTFSATVKNQGTVSTPPNTIHGIRFAVDGVNGAYSDAYTSSIAPGQSVTMIGNTGTVWRAVSGSHTVSATVDYGNRIQESNEGNNGYFEQITIPVPVTPSPTPSATAVVSASPTSSATPCSTISSSAARVQGTVSLSTTGTYYVWSRMMASSADANSFYLQIDDWCPVVIGDNLAIPIDAWRWVNYSAGNTSERVSLNLSAGDHSVSLISRESGVKIDDVLFITNPACVPTDLGTNCIGAVVQPSPSASASPLSSQSPTPSRSASPRPSTTTNPSGSSNTVYPTADVHVEKNNPARNYGKEDELEVDGSPIKIIYMRFDLRSFSGKTTKQAKLRIRLSDSSSSTQIIKDVPTLSWTETSVTYNSRPSVGSVITSIRGGSSGTWKEIDLTQYVNSKMGKQFSVAFDSSGSNGLDFYSRESSRKPELVLQF